MKVLPFDDYFFYYFLILFLLIHFFRLYRYRSITIIIIIIIRRSIFESSYQFSRDSVHCHSFNVEWRLCSKSSGFMRADLRNFLLRCLHWCRSGAWTKALRPKLRSVPKYIETSLSRECGCSPSASMLSVAIKSGDMTGHISGS